MLRRHLAGCHRRVRYSNYEKLPALNVQNVQRQRVTQFMFFVFGAFGMASMLLQLYNIALLGAFWPFFAGIVYQLVTAMSQFARMILLLPE